jgi:hypothetical protein
MANKKKEAPIKTIAMISEKKRRIAQVLEWLVGGVPSGDIERLGCQQFECSPRSMRNYIAHCRHKILPTWYEWSDKRVLAAEQLSKLERVYAKAIASDQLHAACRALRQAAEIQGLLQQAPQIGVRVDAEAAIVTAGSLEPEKIDRLRAMFGLPAKAEVEALPASKGNGEPVH